MAEKIILTEEEWCVCQLGSDRGGTYADYLKEMKICEYCGEHEAQFSIEVNCTDNSVQDSNLVCASCVATWFTETPENVESMSIVRLEA
ncbi:hypothetical protein LCGC14_0761930 [marine sediment metagenome]|uniref:Uncharacterized protein n=1 Tax=marine sediment metagenome TaxID=412755 RepID=A0A0F9QKP3_9ZZZZ|nr:hypothetical protein [bacterium]